MKTLYGHNIFDIYELHINTCKPYSFYFYCVAIDEDNFSIDEHDLDMDMTAEDVKYNALTFLDNYYGLVIAVTGEGLSVENIHLFQTKINGDDLDFHDLSLEEENEHFNVLHGHTLESDFMRLCKKLRDGSLESNFITELQKLIVNPFDPNIQSKEDIELITNAAYADISAIMEGGKIRDVIDF